MIPSLSGRWQTRIFLFIFIGLPITALYGWWLTDEWWGNLNQILYLVLTTILLVGLVLDPVYIWIQTFRWERDWPFAFQLFFSWIEFGIVVFLIRSDLLPWFPTGALASSEMVETATIHFSWVFFVSFLMLLGGMQLFFIRWRFKAAEFGRM